MAAGTSVVKSDWSDDLEAFFRQLQHETIWLALAGTLLASVIVLGFGGLFSDPGHAFLTAMGLIILTGAVVLLRRTSYLASAVVLIAGMLTTIAAAVVWGGLTEAIYLLVVPVGLATLAITRAAGLTLAVVATLLLLLAPTPPVPGDLRTRVVATTLIWSTVGMIWITLRPLLSAVHWAWSGYERSVELLAEARESQRRLGETLQDLADANIQLTRLNRQADGLRQAAEEERNAKAQFVANVSHELRTPLNMIIGFSEMITQAPRTYGAVPPALLADLDVVLRNSQHLASLIDDVLDLSQIEARQMALTKERANLAEVIEAAAVAVRPLYESKGLRLTLHVPSSLPPVLCDRTRIREVVLNLLSNAGRFTEHGGVEVQVWQEGPDVVFSVADSGIGIAAQDRERLFTPFHQADATLRRRFGGTGLGLSISRSFVELHGGQMWLESRLGEGTTVFVRLPIDPREPEAAGLPGRPIPGWEFLQRTRRSRAPVANAPARLIVVERGNALQHLLERYLDAEIVHAGDLQQAATEHERAPARALLVNELRIDEALRRMEGSSMLPFDIPTIFCTVPGIEEATDALGVSDYLVKPVSRDRLLAALDRVAHTVETILVADDEPDARQLFRRMLASAGRGYRVLRATNGQQALEVLQRQRVDVVLLDLVMPEMDGFDLLAAMAGNESLREIPVILVSGRDPLGQPIVSKALAVTTRGGLSAPGLLASIEALSTLLGRAVRANDPAQSEARAG